MNEGSLKQVHAVITAKRVRITLDEARDLARRASADSSRNAVDCRPSPLQILGRNAWPKGIAVLQSE